MKHNGIILLNSILLGNIALSCIKGNDSNNTDKYIDINKVNDLVETSFNGGCISDKRFYTNRHTTIIAESYEIVENLDKKKNKADFFLYINALAMVKANFNITDNQFNVIEQFSRASIYKVNRIKSGLKSYYKIPISKTLVTDDPTQKMVIMEKKKKYRFPLIKSNDHIGFIDNKKIPHIINKKVFAEIFSNNLKSFIYV